MIVNEGSVEPKATATNKSLESVRQIIVINTMMICN